MVILQTPRNPATPLVKAYPPVESKKFIEVESKPTQVNITRRDWFSRIPVLDTFTSASPPTRPYGLPSMSIDFPKEEEAVIARWREIKAFERQVRTPLT